MRAGPLRRLGSLHTLHLLVDGVVRPLPLISLGLLSGLLGAGVAWWMSAPPSATPSLPVLLPALVREPEPPPPSRDQLVRLQQDQLLSVQRPDGTTIPIGYTSAVIDPRWVTVEFFGGWNREMDANADLEALAFSSGPTFARAPGNGELQMRLHGDLLMANGLFSAGNRAAAAERAWLGITSEGALEFGYGALTPALSDRLRVFIGGLHAFTNTTQVAPASYVGVYGEMKLADVRIIYGLRADGLLEVIETDDGVLFSDLSLFVEQKGLLASYLPDHASKSRLIVPGERHWSEEHAIWVSGGKPSITQMPFLLRFTPSAAWHLRQPEMASGGTEPHISDP